MYQKRQPYRNKKILEAARGEPCLARFPGCTGGGEDTVFCHLNEPWAGKGIGQKADDCAGFFGCQNCHKRYDNYEFNADDMICVLRAYYRTIRRLLDKGVLK